MTEPYEQTTRRAPAQPDRDEYDRVRFDRRHAWVRFIGTLSTVVRLAGSLCALVLAGHVVLTLGQANPDHMVTRFVSRLADPLALGLQDLFVPADPRLAVLLNYGIAALFWLFVTSIATRVLRGLV